MAKLNGEKCKNHELTMKKVWSDRLRVGKVKSRPKMQIVFNFYGVLLTGLPFGLKKGQISQIWPFLKLFARNKMVWPFGNFLAFFES